MSTAAFLIIAIVTLAGALAAATLPKLIHSALCLVVAFIGLAAFYFWLGAEFVGLVQVFVYVGAVAVLIVFTILLTRPADEKPERFKWSGALIALAVFAALAWAILHTPTLAECGTSDRCPHRQTHRRNLNDRLRLAAAMHRRLTHRCAARSPRPRDGGKAMSAELWGAHAYSVLVSGFSRNELWRRCQTLGRGGKFVSAECGNQHAASVRSPIRIHTP